MLRGRTTGIPAKSACICINKSFRAAPPSTRNVAIGAARSLFIAPISSVLESAIASSAARAMCAFVVPRVSPRIAPRACGSQSGAPRPVSAGTTTTPALSGTLAASASMSSERSINPSSSRSHCTRAPATNTDPSSTYSGPLAPAPAPIEVNIPVVEVMALRPLFASRKQPVPYVFFAEPTVNPAWPKSAAC